MAESIMQKKTIKGFIGQVLINPWVILLSILMGTFIGVTNKPLATLLAPFGNLYLTLLQMCVLPIMIAAVIGGLGNLFRAGKAARYLTRMIGVYALSLFLAAVATLLISISTQIGSQLSKADKSAISKQLAKTETAKVIDSEYDTTPDLAYKIAKSVSNIVPSNVFAAMSKGENLAVLFFCLALGVAIGKSRAEGAGIFLKVLESTSEALLTIVGWTMYALPFGLLCLLAGYVGHTGLGILITLFKVILLYTAVILALLIVSSIIIWRRTGKPYLQTWIALKEPLIIAFSTRSSFAAMPAALRGLHNKLGMDKQAVDLVMPVGIMLNPAGSVSHYCLVAVFLSQLYGLPFGGEQFVITTFTAIGASLAATGVPSIVALGLLPIVLNPLGLPIDVGMILVAAIDTLVDPLMTMLNIYGNCAAATLVIDKSVEGECAAEAASSGA